MPNPIPTHRREQVNQRERYRCLRCGGRGAEWHHRRRRNVRHSHDPHCACNGVLLCPTCHRFVHRYKGQGRREGFILPAVVHDPYNQPVTTWRGPVYLNCTGRFEVATGEREHTDEPEDR